MHSRSEVVHGCGRLLTIEVDSVSSVEDAADALVGLLRQLEQADGRVVVLLGRGDGLLFAGPLEDGSDRRLLAQLCGALVDHPMPVVCATAGSLVDASLDICLACDLRYASPDSTVGFPAARRGLLPVGGITRLARLGGRAMAARAALLGATFSGADDVGLAAFLTIADDPISVAGQAGELLAGSAPLVLEALKTSLSMADGPLSAGLAVEADLASLLLPTADRAEGVRALLERRSPEFRGE